MNHDKQCPQVRMSNPDAVCDCDSEAAKKARAARERKNAARRARHQAMVDLGMKRVRGGLGGVYYE